MIAPESLQWISEHPAFGALSEKHREKISQEVTEVCFEIGEVLSDQTLVPHRILLIRDGNARLVTMLADRPYTVCRLGPGDVVGLASFLRAAGCEQVRASQRVRALALPDRLILELFKDCSSFRDWCESTVFPVELAELYRQLGVEKQATAEGLRGWVEALATRAQLITDSHGHKSNGSDQWASFMASANGVIHKLGDLIPVGSGLPQVHPPLPARVIGVPIECLNDAALKLRQEPELKEKVVGIDNQSTASEQHHGLPIKTPLASALDLGRPESQPKLKLVRARGAADEVLACFQMVGQVLQLPFRRDAIEKTVRSQVSGGRKASLTVLGQIAAGMNLHVVSITIPGSQAVRIRPPALFYWQDSLVLAVSASSEGLVVASPRDGWIKIKPQELSEKLGASSEFLVLDRTTSTQEKKFGFEWFLPSLRRYRGVLGLVLVASFVVQFFSLANPLIIQVIIDKVISQRSLDTLQILGIALLVITLLEGVLTSLRTFLLTETTNRIDSRLGAEVIDHLLKLPLSYFDRRPTGELSTRVSELEKIRQFLTGTALTSILDAAFSVIYIIVMLIYSIRLTAVALAVLPIQILVTALGGPLFRRQYRLTAEDNARTQSHLVEILTGIQTVKAQNVEVVSRWRWQELYNRYIEHAFQKTITGTGVSQTSQVLQKISQLLVLWVGAVMVLNGQLTLGQLIAFRIISGYVTQPLLRLSTMWQNFQEIRVSLERLADVVDTPEESGEADRTNVQLPPIKGAVRFEETSFAFGVGQPLVLKNINLDVEQGSFIGIVGQSGSGKSTLMKLLSRLYPISSGKIYIDGMPIDKVELYSLRRQIGIVPQEPLLFSGSITKNISISDPDASDNEIIEAAKVAAAHEFIMELPLGYSTNAGERGSALSGGQRQRIAIARTLLTKPRLLIMDEATSALDYNTEKKVCSNLKESLKGTTIFFVTHRLPTVMHADVIVMLDGGAIVEQGSHQELMSRRGSYYALYRQQEASQ